MFIRRRCWNEFHSPPDYIHHISFTLSLSLSVSVWFYAMMFLFIDLFMNILSPICYTLSSWWSLHKRFFSLFFWFGGTLLFFFSKQMRPFSACLYVLDVYTHTHSLWCWWWWLFLNNYSTRKTGWFALVIFIDPTAQCYVNGKQMCAISPIATYRPCQKSNETKK
jgi:hypothetical protein